MYFIYRDPLKFMGYELGSQTIYKVKGNDIQTVVNGSFQEDQIVETLDKYFFNKIHQPLYCMFQMYLSRNTNASQKINHHRQVCRLRRADPIR